MNKSKPVIGISSCLLGNNVRYDGKNKRNGHIINNLSEHLEFIAICPETGIGLSVPREPIQLVGNLMHARAVGVENKNIDVTEPLITYAEKIANTYPEIGGFVFKSRSPSCGIRDTPVVDSTNEQIAYRGGLFTQRLIQLKPHLPVEDETRLLDKATLTTFINDVIAYAKKNPL